MDPSITPPLPNRVTSADDQIEDSTMYVITRTGKREPLDTNQITRRFQTLMNRKPKIQHINPYELMLSVCNGLKSDISTYEIDEYAAGAASSMSISNPNYLKMAARIAIDNHQKNTIRSFVDKMRKAYLNDQDGKINSLLNAKFFKYVEEHQDFIEKTIDYGRDFLLDFFGFRTFQNQYSIKIKDKPIERPQDMFMRTAIDLNMYTTESIEQELQNIKETYDLLSNKFYTHASPTYFNAGGMHNQYASCFLLGTDDSRAGIMKTANDISEISKWAGGIGVHTNEYRGAGAMIRSTNGRAGGILPWYRIFEATLQAFNQGGRRPGRGAMYIMPHHPDIEIFCEMARNTGDDNRRVRDLFYAVWLPDLFMERVRKNEIWSLFDPDKTINLANYTGTEYTAKYLELENKKLYTKQLPARNIWKSIYDTNKEVGMPYICFADTVNRLSMQKNIGVIKSSNLCSEIVLYSDAKEYAICILSSIALSNFVQDTYTDEELAQPEESRRILDHEFPLNPYFNFTQLIKVTKTVVRNLNYIVDKTFHPVVETKRSNARHRPIGVGVQGLDDAYAKMRYPFSSDEAASLNKKIFETIYYAAVSQSAMLAREDYIKLKKTAETNGSVSVKTYVPEHYDEVIVTYTAGTLPKTIGAYPSMLWNGGSPISKGTFHWELAGLTPDKLSGMYDWESLRDLVKQFGVKNSQLLAIPPTASTSQLLGNNECVEPYTSNIYTRETQAGKYVVVKKYLMHDLYRLGIWGPNIKDYLIATEGSIQHIEGIPDEIKRLYPTVYEIDQMHIITQAAARQAFIDQAESINLYSTNVSMTEWNKLLFAAYDLGSKTGKYYLHSKEAVPAQKFTLDPAKQAEMKQLLEKIKQQPAKLEQLKDVCDACSS